MGWPEKTDDLNYWYPTSVMVTGYDIIFFWVARMIFSGMEQMDKEPFHTVFIHGLVRDSQGRKMSKSLGNGIDPMDMIDQFGADALRFNLITGNSPGNDMRFYVEKCEAMRNFCNKIWNASRFVMMNLTIDKNELPEKLEIEDKWILSKLNDTVREVNINMDAFELGVASGKIYDFIWDTYCDWYIELTKPRLNSDDEELKINTQFEMVMDAIKAVRARRAEMNVPPSRKAHLFIVTDKQAAFEAGKNYISKLAYSSDVSILSDLPDGSDKMVSVITDNARLFMPMSDLVDFEAEKARLTKEIEKTEKLIAGQVAKLANENFVSRAPEAVVNTEREKKAKLEALLENLKLSLSNLG